MNRFRATLLLMVGILATCQPVGINRDDAVRLALDAAGPASRALSVESGLLGDFVDPRALTDVPRDRRVWVVELAGVFPGECVVTATGESRCLPSATTALVVLDERTGELLVTEIPAP